MILEGKPHLRHRDHYYPSPFADSNNLARACVKVWNVLKNLKGGYEWKEFAGELNPRCGHQQDLKVRFAAGMRAEVLQPRFFYIYADHLVKAPCDKFSNEPVPTTHVQISSAFRTALDRIDPAERKAREFFGSSPSMPRCRPAKHRGVLNFHC
jgi:hypothetical protein